MVKPRAAKGMLKMLPARIQKESNGEATTGKVKVYLGYRRNVLSANDIVAMKAKAMAIAAEVDLFVSSTFKS